MSDEAWQQCVKDIAEMKNEINNLKGQIDVLIKSSDNLGMIIKYVVTPLIIGTLTLFGIKAVT